jgi:hypothetical protein
VAKIESYPGNSAWQLDFIYRLNHVFLHVKSPKTWKSAIFTCHIWNMREVLVYGQEKWKKFIADFHVLGHFMAKKHDLSEKKNPSVTRRCWTKFVSTLQKSPWKLESWNFGSRTILGQLDALHTQNFEIWHSKGTSHINFDKTVDAQFGSLAVRR